MQELLLLVLMFGLVACADPEDPPPVATKSAVLTGSGGPRTGSQADGGGCDCARCNQPAPTPKAAAGPVTPPPAAQLLSAADLQWSDFAEFDEAASAARLYEDKQSKASVLYLKLPKKFAVTGKRHPASLFSTVIKGAITVAVGDDKPTALKVGSFLLIPANTPYSLTAKKGATLFVSSMPPPYHSAAGSSAKLGDSADVFHRNVANLVIHTDLNMLSVLQYAVEVLEIRNIIVCGHYGCGGVRAALDAKPLGLIENWLRHIQDLARHHKHELAALPSDDARAARLCELNVIDQVLNVAETTVLEAAWARNQPVTVHGWIYDLSDGRIRDLDVQLSSAADLARLRALE